MSKSPGMRRFTAIAASLLLTITLSTGAQAQAGAAGARALSRVLGIEAGGAARAGAKGVFEAGVTVPKLDLSSPGSVSQRTGILNTRPDLSLRDSNGDGAVLEALRGDQPSLRPNQSALPGEALRSLCLNDELASSEVRRYLYRQSRYHTSSSWERDDLTQQTLLKLLEACSRLLVDPPRDGAAYVAPTMQRVWVDTYRRSDKAKGALFVSEAEAEEALGRIVDPRPGPAKIAEAWQLLDRATKAEAMLTKRQQEVIALLLHEENGAEVARSLGISPTRVEEITKESQNKFRAAAGLPRLARDPERVR